MNIYRITYIRNEAAICKNVNGTAELNGSYHYEHNNGQLIYALIKAENEEKALAIAQLLTKEVNMGD